VFTQGIPDLGALRSVSPDVFIALNLSPYQLADRGLAEWLISLFVSRLGLRAADLVLVDAVTRLAHELGLTVIAEGIETLEQLDVLRSLGADAAQGYLFARPAPLEEILSQSVVIAPASGASPAPAAAPSRDRAEFGD
jgi:EAL domain-containing protein (putative c-di-GMP-specific phosphodiesterase class I)